MTIDPNALWLLIVAAVITGGGAKLMSRLNDIERTLYKHGNKLVRIETKLGIPDPNGNEDE